MKQTITRSQFKEVDPKIMIKKFGDYGYHWDDITIGRMIEFLDEQEEALPTGDYIKNKYRIDITMNGEELADALWEACKEVLDN